jgi:hypothetical protein
MFRQQLIQAWKPVPTPCTSIILYTVLSKHCIHLAIFFTSLGVIMYIFTTQENYIEMRYDDTCQGLPVCTLNITITNGITAPVYLYYGLREFYQNHRKYLKYRSTDQL